MPRVRLQPATACAPWPVRRGREPQQETRAHAPQRETRVPAWRREQRARPRQRARRKQGVPVRPVPQQPRSTASQRSQRGGTRHPSASPHRDDPTRPRGDPERCWQPDGARWRGLRPGSPESPGQASRRCGWSGAWAQNQPAGRRKAMRRRLSGRAARRGEAVESGSDHPRHSGDEGNDRVNTTLDALGMPCTAHKLLPRRAESRP